MRPMNKKGQAAMTTTEKPKVKQKRYAYPVTLTLPPLTKMEGRRQARARNLSFSRWVAMLIERESVKPDPELM